MKTFFHFVFGALILVAIVSCSDNATDNPADNATVQGEEGTIPGIQFLRVVSTYPDPSTYEEISVLDSIVVVFSNPIDPATVTPETFTLVHGPGVTGHFTVDGCTVTFDADRAYNFAVLIRFVLTTEIKSLDGLSLLEPYTFDVYTEVEPG